MAKSVDFSDEMLPSLAEQEAVEHAVGKCRSTTTVLHALAIFVGTELDDLEGMRSIASFAGKYAKHEVSKV